MAPSSIRISVSVYGKVSAAVRQSFCPQVRMSCGASLRRQGHLLISKYTLDAPEGQPVECAAELTILGQVTRALGGREDVRARSGPGANVKGAGGNVGNSLKTCWFWQANVLRRSTRSAAASWNE